MTWVNLMKWIDEQEYAQYGECYGTLLNHLIEQDYVKVWGPDEHQEGFIAKGRGMMYRAVSLTEAGKKALKRELET